MLCCFFIYVPHTPAPEAVQRAAAPGSDGASPASSGTVSSFFLLPLPLGASPVAVPMLEESQVFLEMEKLQVEMLTHKVLGLDFHELP